MKVEMIESFEVTGFSLRTKSMDEWDMSTAKIGGLWGQFGAELAPFLTEKSKVYGHIY